MFSLNFSSSMSVFSILDHPCSFTVDYGVGIDDETPFRLFLIYFLNLNNNISMLIRSATAKMQSGQL